MGITYSRNILLSCVLVGFMVGGTTELVYSAPIQYTLIGSTSSCAGQPGCPADDAASGTFTLDDPLGMNPTAFVAWNLTFNGTTFSNTDSLPVLSNTCTPGPLPGGSCSLTQGLAFEAPYMHQFSVQPLNSLGFRHFHVIVLAFDPEFGVDKDWQYEGQYAPVPEPSTFILSATGLLGLAGYRWAQRRRERIQVG